MQYPLMDFCFGDNPYIDITKIISANLAAWMESGVGPRTLKDLARVSSVGFGTVQRARNGNGNTTIQNLELIANAYKRHAADLLRPNDLMYAASIAGAASSVQENANNIVKFGNPDGEHPTIVEVIKIMRRMNDHGKARALKHVQLVSEEHIFEAQSIKRQ